MSLGTFSELLSPWPSCPLTLNPKEKTFPLSIQGMDRDLTCESNYVLAAIGCKYFYHILVSQFLNRLQVPCFVVLRLQQRIAGCAELVIAHLVISA